MKIRPVVAKDVTNEHTRTLPWSSSGQIWHTIPASSYGKEKTHENAVKIVIHQAKNLIKKFVNTDHHEEFQNWVIHLFKGQQQWA